MQSPTSPTESAPLGTATPVPTQPAQPGNDMAWMRRQIAVVRSDIEDLIRPIYWTPGMDGVCSRLQAAVEHLKAARDATHLYESRFCNPTRDDLPA